MTTIHQHPFDIDTYNDFECAASDGGKIVLVVDNMDHCNAILAAYIKKYAMNTALIRSTVHHNTGNLENGYGYYGIYNSSAPAIIASKSSINGFNCYIFDSYQNFSSGRNKTIIDQIICDRYTPIIFIVDTKNETIPVKTDHDYNVVTIPNFDYQPKEWTPEEDEFLRKYYRIIGTDVCGYIDGARDIDCYRRYMYICNNGSSIVNNNDQKHAPIDKEHSNWTEDEDNILREYYNSEGTDVIKRLPGRSFTDCYNRACELGVISKVTGKWTEKEDNILREHYTTEGSDIIKRLPGRTYAACSRRYKLIARSNK